MEISGRSLMCLLGAMRIIIITPNCNNVVVEKSKKKKGKYELIKHYQDIFEIRLTKRPQKASKYTEINLSYRPDNISTDINSRASCKCYQI